MELSHSREVTRPIMKYEIYYRDSILSQINPVKSPYLISLSPTLILHSNLLTRIPICLCFQVFRQKFSILSLPSLLPIRTYSSFHKCNDKYFPKKEIVLKTNKNWPSPCSRDPLEKLTATQPIVKFPASYGTPKITKAFVLGRHWYPSWAWRIHSTISNSSFQRSSLKLCKHIRLRLTSNLFPSGCPAKIPCAFFTSHANYLSRLSHSPLFGSSSNPIYGKECKLWSFW